MLRRDCPMINIEVDRLTFTDGSWMESSGVTAGPSGSSGASGISGFSGFSGFSGISGWSGRSGYSGGSGQSGWSGISGFSGLGLSGYSGFSGATGSAGTSGYSGYSGYSGAAGSGGTASVVWGSGTGHTYTWFSNNTPTSLNDRSAGYYAGDIWMTYTDMIYSGYGLNITIGSGTWISGESGGEYYSGKVLSGSGTLSGDGSTNSGFDMVFWIGNIKTASGTDHIITEERCSSGTGNAYTPDANYWDEFGGSGESTGLIWYGYQVTTTFPLYKNASAVYISIKDMDGDANWYQIISV